MKGITVENVISLTAITVNGHNLSFRSATLELPSDDDSRWEVVAHDVNMDTHSIMLSGIDSQFAAELHLTAEDGRTFLGHAYRHDQPGPAGNLPAGLVAAMHGTISFSSYEELEENLSDT